MLVQQVKESEMSIEKMSPGQLALAMIAIGVAAAVAAVLQVFHKEEVERPSQLTIPDRKWPIPATDSEESLAV